MCIVFSVIGRVYRCLRVIFWDPSILCIHFFVYFKSGMSDLLLGTLGHCLFHHYVHCWCDFISCLVWVDHYSSSCYLLHHHPRFTFDSSILSYHYSFLIATHFQVWHFLCIIITHLIISLIFLHYLVVVIIFTLGTFRSIAHDFLYMLTWGHGFLIIGYLDLVSLHFYHPITLAYVRSRFLRPPWGHGIRCHLRQPPLGQVFEIWLIFGCRHASYSGRCFLDVWVRFGLQGSHIWWWMISCHPISDLPYI